MNIGIVGNGYVGKATALFGCKDINVLIYDKIEEKFYPPEHTLKFNVDNVNVKQGQPYLSF